MQSILKRSENFKEARFLRSKNIYPFFKPMAASEGSRVESDGKKLVMIGSNNYLGLTQDPRVKKAAYEALERFGTGCTGSRFLNGNTELHDELETKLAQFVGKESALVMTTGFLTNYASIGTLVDEGDFILSDDENHASIIAGCRSSKAKTVVYHHNDISDLHSKLSALPADATKLIVVDGVFSMTGEVAKLKEICALKKEFKNVAILVDDAHGLGVLGKNGSGTCDYLGVTDEVDFITGTFSKSFASIGGFIAGPAIVMDYLRHKARGFIFSAALPPASAAAVLAVLDILESDPSVLANLQENVQRAKELYEDLGLPILGSSTPILSVKIGDETKTLMTVKMLEMAGVFATPVLFPAVPFGNGLIRTSYMSTHQTEDFEIIRRAWSVVVQQIGLTRSNGPVEIIRSERKEYGFQVH